MRVSRSIIKHLVYKTITFMAYSICNNFVTIYKYDQSNIYAKEKSERYYMKQKPRYT